MNLYNCEVRGCKNNVAHKMKFMAIEIYLCQHHAEVGRKILLKTQLAWANFIYRVEEKIRNLPI